MTRNPDDATQDDRALAAEYALGLLDADAARAFEDRMARAPELRALHAAWAEDFAQMARDLPEVAPPPGGYDKLAARLFPLDRRGLGLAGAFKALLGMGAAVALLLLFVGAYTPPPPPGPPVYAADLRAAGGQVQVAARLEPSGDLVLAIEAAALPPGRVLEVWLIAAGDAAPVSLGVVPAGVDLARLPVPGPLAARFPGAALALSEEPPGGSPTGAPTGAVLAAAALTQL